MLDEESAFIKYQIQQRVSKPNRYRLFFEYCFINIDEFYLLNEVLDYISDNLPEFKFSNKFKKLQPKKDEMFWKEVKHKIAEETFINWNKARGYAHNLCDACGADPCMCSDPF